tara:strand:- start:231 stop:686 length:456 start_codon:yes stop_codon:yes gene_type:complete
MIYIKANKINYTTNIIYSILLDKLVFSTDVTPITWSWLLVLTNDFTKEVFTQVMILDKSAQRYNRNMVQFVISAKLGGTSNGLNQQISFDNVGYYSYEIYYQPSLTNLNPDDAINSFEAVQTGKALVHSSKSEVRYPAQKDGNPNNFIFVP